jgi:hypothetical protein
MGCERRGNHRAEFDHAAAGQGTLAHETLSEVEADNALCILWRVLQGQAQGSRGCASF